MYTIEQCVHSHSSHCGFRMYNHWVTSGNPPPMTILLNLVSANYSLPQNDLMTVEAELYAQFETRTISEREIQHLLH